MATCRSMCVFALVFVWTAIPALACLPNGTMTQEEMACCKKMAGDCHMAAEHHPCCKTKVERTTPVATLDRTAAQIQPSVAGTPLGMTVLAEPTLDRAGRSEPRGLPPPEPPGLNPVLRI